MALSIALVGCGAMGSALLKGWLSLPDSLERFEKFWIIAPHRERVEPFLTDARVHWFSSAEGLKESPDIIVFAIKPYLLEDILPSYTSYNSLFISVAAGKSLSFYQKILSPSFPLVRAMPNTPVMIHQGIIGLLTHAQLTENQQAMIVACFQGLGLCLWVESDDKLNKLTAISGSGPAYVFAMIEALSQGAESLGFDKKTSLRLSLHTFLGASIYAQQSDESPSLLRQRVTSPLGTTAAALRVLETGKLNDLISQAVEAAYHRARGANELKTKAFAACLGVIEKEGWKNFSFAKAAQDSAIPLHVFHEQFASPSDVMIHLFHLIDQDVLKNLNSFETLSPKDALFDILMSRFEAAQPYKLVLKNFWWEWILSPNEAPAFVCQGFSSMAWMLEAAGLRTLGFKGLMRIQGLTTLYLVTLKTWLTDDSPDLGKTMVCLDKGLGRLESMARFLNNF